MLAIDVELLTGRYVATVYNDPGRAEWPPHPGRLFSALVATHAEDEGTPEERTALEWLEAQDPPRVVASAAHARTVCPIFVPVNDQQTVSEPDGAREKLREAEARLAATDPDDVKAVERAKKNRDKAKKKLRADTEKATAPPKTFGRGPRLTAHRMLPNNRLRQPRTFPSVVPDRPVVRFAWSAEAPEAVRSALDALCARLIRLGHSSTLVAARTVTAEQELEGPALVPDDDGTFRLRVPRAGLLEKLDVAFAQHRGVAPSRTLPRFVARYRSTEADAPGAEKARSLFGADWVVFERVGGARLPIVRSPDLAAALRGAVSKHAADPAPGALTGHGPNGERIERPHVAFQSLPFVAHRHATGSLLGVTLVLPRQIDEAERRAVLRSVATWEDAVRVDDEESPVVELQLGRSGVVRVRRVPYGIQPKATLRPATWCEPSTRWATATPIALDRNPGNLQDRDARRRARAFEAAEETVRRACAHIGLPEPDQVQVLLSSVLPGTSKPRDFGPFPRTKDGKHRRVLVHARLRFAEPVGGPVMLGAGRFLGLGLLRPVSEERT